MQVSRRLSGSILLTLVVVLLSSCGGSSATPSTTTAAHHGSAATHSCSGEGAFAESHPQTVAFAQSNAGLVTAVITHESLLAQLSQNPSSANLAKAKQVLGDANYAALVADSAQINQLVLPYVAEVKCILSNQGGTSTTTDSTTTSTTTPPIAQNFTSHQSVADSLGYQYDLAIQLNNSLATTSITNALPGSTDIEISSSGTIAIVNTTPGRNANVGQLFPLGPHVGGLYLATRPSCALSGGTISLTTGGNPGTYCWIQFGTGQNFPASGSNPDGSLSPNSGVTMSFNSGPQKLGSVSDSNASTIASDLNSGPNYWAFAVPVGASSLTDHCHFANGNVTEEIGILFTNVANSVSCTDAN